LAERDSQNEGRVIDEWSHTRFRVRFHNSISADSSHW
jgi:hypothetical protein